MTEKELLTDVSGAVTDEAVTLEIDVLPQNWIHRLLLKWGILPKQKVYQVRSITLGSLIRISEKLLAINLSEMSADSILEDNYKLMKEHGHGIAEIIAIAIVNRKAAPPKSLVSFLENNLTAKELLRVLQIVLRKMDVTNFMSSIISIRGLNALEKKNASAQRAERNEVSPMSQGS